ncbi:MAG: S-layer homology domain-containing protein [Oscillospiraceae bacterium]|jgi:dienelactone hydrolase|nr:S-layer homology domain-containing protein [Oscillospiraceae bacterium]
MLKSRKIARLLAVTTALSLLAGVPAVSASAESDTVKMAFFMVADPPSPLTPVPVEAEGDIPAHQLVQAIVGGEQTTLKVLPNGDLFPRDPSVWSNPILENGYTIRNGLWNITVNEEGFVTKIAPVPGVDTGYFTNPGADGSIILGVKEKQYFYNDDVVVYCPGEAGLTIGIGDIKSDYNDQWFAVPDENGKVGEIYITVGMDDGTGKIAYEKEIKSFDSAWGPVDEKSGLAIEYTYYAPEIKAEDAKYPLVVWFHGVYGGGGTWTSLLELNPIAAWAGEAFQSEFDAGGAYIMTPRANEDLNEGHQQTWNQAQVAPFFLALDEFLAKNPNVDTDRIYVGGYSMGGGMTWLTLRERPDFFAAAFPTCPFPYMPYGTGAAAELDKFAALPIWQTHGIADPIIPSTFTTDMIDPLSAGAKRTGTDTRFTILPEGFSFIMDHLAWLPVLQNFTESDGSLTLDAEGKPVPGTVTAWLNAQSRSANLRRAEEAEKIREAEYADVNAGQWFYQYVSLLTEAGTVNGVSKGLFAPDSDATLGQILKIVMLAAGYEAQTPTDGHWASGYLAAAVRDGLFEDAADLDGEAKRLTVARIAARALKLETTLDESPFKDTDDASVLALYENGVVSGDDTGNFNPEKGLTRAEMSKIALLIATARA